MVGAVERRADARRRRGGATIGKGACFYWRYEKFIRRSESRTNSTVGATGAIYAIRRTLFEPIPDDTMLDDVLIPLRIVRRGYRVVFEPAARAYDDATPPPPESSSEKCGRSRARSSCFARERWLFDPLRNRVWFETMSHKGLRLAAPLLQLLLFAANFGLADLLFYRWLLAAQVVFYAAALGGHAHRHAQASSLRPDGPVRSLRVELGRDRRVRPVSHRPAAGDLGAGGIDRARVSASVGESGPPPVSRSFGMRTMNASRRFVPALPVQM